MLELGVAILTKFIHKKIKFIDIEFQKRQNKNSRKLIKNSKSSKRSWFVDVKRGVGKVSFETIDFNLLFPSLDTVILPIFG
mgnify:CR=1 FL=1